MHMKPEDIQKELYDIPVGAFICPNNVSSITRVPGGWVYSDMQGCCFIPYISYKDANY